LVFPIQDCTRKYLLELEQKLIDTLLPEYLNILFSILKPYCNMSSPHLSQAKLKGNTYEYLAFSS